MPKIKYTPAQLLELWHEYKAKADSQEWQEVSAGKVVTYKRPRIYTLEAFLVHIVLSRQAWSEYSKRKAYREVIEYINEVVFARKKEALVNQEGSTTGLIFDMKANYGINDKTIIDATIDGTIEVSLDLGGPKANESSREEED